MNSTLTTKNHHQNEFISPPVTPKSQLESQFLKLNTTEEDGWDSSSTTSSNSTTSSMSMMYKKKTPRKQQRPFQSLPKSTKGTFFMPTFVTEVPQLIAPPQHHQRPLITTLNKSITHNPLIPSLKRKHSIAHHCTTTTPYVIVTTPTPAVIPEETINEKAMVTTTIDQIKLPEEPLQEEAQTIKKAKTSAAYVYDNVTAETDQSELFMNNEEWIPKLEVFDRRPTVRIQWKGSPLKIRHMPYFEKLHPGEVTIAATLRLTPEQYLKCKWALVLAAKEASENNTLFRKSEAQKVCCIDVNKTSVLWNAFGKLGWLGSKWPQ